MHRLYKIKEGVEGLEIGRKVEDGVGRKYKGVKTVEGKH